MYEVSLHWQAALNTRCVLPRRYSAPSPQDTSWLDLYLSDIPHVVMQVDDKHLTVGMQHSTSANKGHEAMAYLQFIIDYYERLPGCIVFAHGHRSAWHQLDIVPVLQRLRWGEHGFANLRYGPNEQLDWTCGLDQEVAVPCNWTGGEMRPGDLKSLRNRDPHDGVLVGSHDMDELWSAVLEDELGTPPKLIRAPCCGNFMVSRERILKHPKRFYQRLRDWLLHTPLDDQRAGVVFEYLYHLIFGEPPVIEPIEQCKLLYCNDL